MQLLTAIALSLLKTFTRITSFVGKEITEVIRQPGTLFSLVLGPFLIMALFGVGYNGQQKPLDTVIVIPQASNLPRDIAFYQQFAGPSVHVTQVTNDATAARAKLEAQQIDLLVIAPENIEQRFKDGQQSQIGVEYNQIDPIRDNYARFVAQRQVQEINRAIIQAAAQQGQQYAVQQVGSNELTSIPPAVIAAPTVADTKNWAPLTPTVVAYFAPAVLALVLQHMGVTLTALSLVRERLSGTLDIFRVSPVRTLEILIGKYLAYGFLTMAIAALITFLVVGVLHVPLLGDPRWFALIVALLTFASLGLGLFISIVATSERQAVQLSMLVLLASVFFSGFVLPLEEFLPAVRNVAYVLPVTHGIALFQDFMLRGGTYHQWQIWALAGVGLALFVFSAIGLRQNMARA